MRKSNFVTASATCALIVSSSLHATVQNEAITYKARDASGQPIATCDLDMNVIYDDAYTGTYKLAFVLPGGGWVSSVALDIGSQEVDALAARGYLVFAPEHRVIETAGGDTKGACGFATREEQNRDVEVAFTTAAFATGWGTYTTEETETVLTVASTKKFLITGFSAGGHLALWLNRYGDNFIRGYIRAVASINGPISFLHQWSHDNGVSVPVYSNSRNIQIGPTYNLTVPGGTGGSGGALVIQPYFVESDQDNCTPAAGNWTGTDCYIDFIEDGQGDRFILDNTFSSWDSHAAPTFTVGSERDFLFAPEMARAVCVWQGELQSATYEPDITGYIAHCGSTNSRYAYLTGTNAEHDIWDADLMDHVIDWAELPALD